MLIAFFSGLFLGVLCGVMLMCVFQIDRERHRE